MATQRAYTPPGLTSKVLPSVSEVAAEFKKILKARAKRTKEKRERIAAAKRLMG